MKISDKKVDILLIGEGTYPYVRGGVSSWMHQLIQGLPELNFGVLFLGSMREEYGEILYEFPENLVYFDTHYLFEESSFSNEGKAKESVDFETIEGLYDWFRNGKGDMPDAARDIKFYTDKVTHSDFLHSRQSWEFIRSRYNENGSDLPFIDYFWTVRSIHAPIWKIAKIIEKLPPFRLLHSPSTGYAGLLGALASYNTGAPFLLTEHGIYTRERKIDMLSADWIKFKKPALLKQPEELNYIKNMWVRFFEKIGHISYTRADKIYSLFPEAREIQISFGAPEEKTEVIPNGVDVDGLKKCYLQRGDSIPKVITLIGRVVSIKDIKTFIRAIRIVANEIKDIEAWVVGPLDEDPLYAEECQSMVKTLKLEKNFKFKGFQNIHEILPLTGLLTLTSISEGMPLTVLEGFAAGIPCVATDVGSCSDLINGGLDDEDIALGDAGMVTPIANPSALAAAYMAMLNDKEKWCRSQEAALKRVRKYYREDRFLDRYKKAYMEML